MNEFNGDSFKYVYPKMLFANDEILLQQVQKQRKKTDSKVRPTERKSGISFVVSSLSQT